MKKRTRTLTKKEKAALLSVKDGADVTGYELAGTLRTIERDFPTFIWIGKVMGDYGSGAGRLPYFGAKATEAGLAASQSKEKALS